MSTDRPLKETSYGGVVVRGDEVLVITPIGKRRVTGLPKGGANPGERPEETAAREVREETGVTATVREPLGDYVSGSTDDHDHEVEEARWIPLAEAVSSLSYPGERALIERALSKSTPGR